jgi:hypothetical protein
MVRKLAILISLTLGSFVVLGQEAQERALPSFFNQFVRHEERIKLLADSLKRDAFIVAQLVHTVGELEDFQKTVAIEKALGRIDAALKRASEKPVAPPGTMENLESVRELLLKTRQQGGLADLADVRRQILRRTDALQHQLFNQLQEARKQRQTLNDLETRLRRVSDDLDAGMIDALGSTFDFIRAGGK